MCVCECVCVCVCVCMCMYVYEHVFFSMGVYMFEYVGVYVCNYNCNLYYIERTHWIGLYYEADLLIIDKTMHKPLNTIH